MNQVLQKERRTILKTINILENSQKVSKMHNSFNTGPPTLLGVLGNIGTGMGSSRLPPVRRRRPDGVSASVAPFVAPKKKSAEVRTHGRVRRR